MSGQQRLNRITRNNRVVAFPTHKKERIVTDGNGDAVLDKNGSKVTEEVQMYRIKPLR